MDSHLDIIKQLVDSLTVQLTNILLRVEAINPLIVRLQEDLDNGNKVDQDTLNQVKQLKFEIDSYHNCMLNLPTVFNEISDIKSDTTNLKIEIDAIKTLLKPVNKISRFIMKPIGGILFFLTTAGSIIAIIEAVKLFFGTGS